MLSDPLLCDKTKLFLEEITTFSSSIAHVRNAIFASYVAHKWNVPFSKVLTWVEDGIKTLPFAIGRLMRVLDVLLDIGFSQEKVNFQFTVAVSKLFFNLDFVSVRYRYGNILPYCKAIPTVWNYSCTLIKKIFLGETLANFSRNSLL